MSVDNKKTILLVDDEAILSMTQKTALEKYGYSAIIENTGETAIEKVKSYPGIDLILMDIDLGKGIDGTEAARIILETYDLPLIFVSSHTEKEIVEKTEGITSYGYVVKNSNITVLDASIKMAFKLFDEKQAVIKQRKYLEGMGSLAKIGAWEYHIQTSKLYWTKEVYNVFELTDTAEIDLDKALKFYTDESSEIMIRAIDLAIKEGKSFIRDSEIITKTDRRKWIRTQGEVVYNEKSKSNIILGTIQDISEIRLLDCVTQESELTLNQVEQITHIGHWSVNTIDGSFFHSDEIKRIFGYEPSEYALSVEEAINAYHPDDRDDVIRLFNRAVETGEGYEFDLRVIQPSGNIRNVHSLGYTELDEKGKVKRVYGVFQDITERKQTEEQLQKVINELNAANEEFVAINEELTSSQNEIMSSEAALRESNEQLILFIKHSPIYAYIKEVTLTESRVLAASENFRDMIGIPGSQMIGKTMDELFPPEFASKISADDWAVASGGNVIRLDEDLNGRHYSTIKFPITLGEKKLTAGYTIDITERKKTEETLQSRQHFLEQMIENSPSAIFITDTEGTLQLANPALKKFLNLSDEQLVGKYNVLKDPVIERKGLLPDFKSVFDHGRTIQFTLEWDGKDNPNMEFRRANELTVQGSMFPVFNKEGQMTNAVCNWIDITQRKLAEEEIQKQLSEKTILLKEVHHRIKNNIASIEGLLSLQSQAISNPEAVSALQDAINRIGSMRVLYDKLLISDVFKDISVKNYLESLIDSIVDLFPDHLKITIDRKIDDFNLSSKNLFPIGIILNELLTNIMKYAFKGRDSGLINVSLSNNKNQATLTIQDNGNGLPEGFDIKKSNGFGLMLVNMLSGQLDGTFTIENHKGTRSVLKFEI